MKATPSRKPIAGVLLTFCRFSVTPNVNRKSLRMCRKPRTRIVSRRNAPVLDAHAFDVSAATQSPLHLAGRGFPSIE